MTASREQPPDLHPFIRLPDTEKLLKNMERKSVKENRQYQEMVLEQGQYLADTYMDYPADDPFVKMVPVRKVRDLVFDENYPYLDRSGFRYRFNHLVNYTAALTLCRFLNWLKYGMRVRGRRNIRKNMKLFRNGAITISNHVYRWDALSVVGACRYREVWIPIYADQLMTRDNWYLKYFCTVPVPSSMAALRKFNEAFDTLATEKKWFHVFPESCRWDYYQPIRPFRKGAFSMAYKYDRPIIPCAISYRPRTGIWKLFGDQSLPLLQLNIGEPIIPDTTRPRRDEVERLRHVSHAAVVKLAGIRHNPWPARFGED